MAATGIRSVTLRIVSEGGKTVLAELDRLGEKKNKLDKPTKVTILDGTKPAQEGFDRLQAAAERYAKTQAQLEKAQARMADINKREGVSIEELSKAQDNLTRATLRNIDAYTRLGEADLATAKKAQIAAAETDKAATRMTVSGEKLKSVGMSMGKWSAMILAAFVGVSVKLGMDFQKQMEILHTQAGATQKEVDAAKNKVLEIASAAGYTGDEIAKALYHPVSGGYKLGQALNIVKLAAEEAKISGSGLEDTTYSLTSVMKSFNIPAHDAGKTMAVLNSIVGQGDMRFQDFNASIKNWAPSAASMGISIKSMGSALAYMTDRGMSAEVASTRLTAGISTMISPTKAASKLLGELNQNLPAKFKGKSLADVMSATGVSATKLAVDLRKPDGIYIALKAIKDMFLKLGMTIPETDVVMAKLFGGARTGKGMMSLMQNLGGIKTKFDDIGKGASKFGDAWHKTQQTLAFQVDKLKVTFENFGTKLGMAIIPPLTKIFGFLTQQKWILPVLAISLGALAAGWIGVQIAAGLAFIAENAALFGIPALIALVVTAIVLIVKHWDAVKHAVEDAFNWLKDHPFVTLLIPVVGIILLVITHWKMLKDIAVTAFHAIADAATWLWDHVLKPIFSALAPVAKIAWLVVSTAAKIAWDIVSGLALGAWAGMKRIFAELSMVAKTVFRDVIAPVARVAWGVVHTSLSAAWVIIKPILHALGDVAKTIFDAIKTAATKTWEAVSGAVKTAIGIAKTVVKTLWDVISRVFGDIIHGAANAFGWVPGLGPKLKDAAKTFDGFRDKVNAALSGINDQNVKVNVNANISTATPHAAGGPIWGAGTGTSDSIPALLSNGEYVVKASAHSRYGTGAMDAVNTGQARIAYADGGAVGAGAAGHKDGVSVAGKFPSVSGIVDTLIGSISKVLAVIAKALGSAIVVAKGESYVGKVPYVWGGESPKGWDCSGFTSYIYKWAGYKGIPRTSESQFGWVNRTNGPVPGGLAFFAGADGTKDSPGHVGIVIDSHRMVNAYDTQDGTCIKPIYGSSGAVSGFGVPPHGFALGGIINEPIAGVGLTTGTPYTFGERGKELVTPLTGGARATGGVARGGDTFNVVIQVPPTANPDAVWKAVHEGLKGYKRRKGGVSLGLA